MKFDNIDMTLLSTLQSHGRMTNVELAEKAGISAPPCLRRLKLLEKKGIITGYHADIDPNSLGLSFHAMCIVTLNSQDPIEVERFLENINRSHNIRTCFSNAGNESFVLSIVAEDLNAYEAILKREIQSSGLVASIKSYILVNKHKYEHGLPIGNAGASMSEMASSQL